MFKSIERFSIYPSPVLQVIDCLKLDCVRFGYACTLIAASLCPYCLSQIGKNAQRLRPEMLINVQHCLSFSYSYIMVVPKQVVNFLIMKVVDVNGFARIFWKTHEAEYQAK